MANEKSLGLIFTLSFVIFCALCPQTSDACSCAMQHPQDSFCAADFVIKAKVKHMKQIYAKRLSDDEDVPIREPFENRYSIRIREILKGKEAIKNISQVHIFTPAYDSMCGVSIEIGHTYVITGYISNNRLSMSLCDFVKVWDKLPKWQRRGMTDRYPANCDCQTKICYNENCYHKNKVEGREDICILELHKDRKMCHINHSFCKRINSECSWSHTSQWRDCRRESSRRKFREP